MQTLDSAFHCDARFNTLCFLFLFLPLTLAAYWALPTRRGKLIWLTVMSFLFYSLWDYRFVALLAASAVVDYTVGRRIGAADDQRTRRAWLWVSVVFNLGLLGFFKYWIFVAANFNGLFDLMDIGGRLPSPKLVLPLGISFYTFQTLSYTIDVYRRQVEPTRDFTKYLAYVSMFPQLVAGPIVRYRTLEEQLDNVPRIPSKAYIATGLTMFVIGLFKKVVVADTFAIWIEPLWNASEMTVVQSWFFVSGFLLQAYFDFSGYSDMAIGLGALLGLRFPINFRAPYSAVNTADLWRRWHMTLFGFVRDYVYIPLGGNRVSSGRMIFNTFFIFILIGLWHQASWTMVLFGAYQAACILLYRYTNTWWDARRIVTQRTMTILLWIIGGPLFMGIDFRAASGAVTASIADISGSLQSMTRIYTGMFGGNGFGDVAPLAWLLLASLATWIFTATVRPAVEMRFKFTAPRAVGLAIALAACVFMVGTDNSPFLYYQF